MCLGCENLAMATLLFADDGLLVAYTVGEARTILKLVMDTGKASGLDISKNNQSRVIKYSTKEQPCTNSIHKSLSKINLEFVTDNTINK